MIMKIIVAWLAVLLLISMVHGCIANKKRGIHGLGKDVALIEGECAMFNWDASEADIEAGIEAWLSLRAK